MLIIINLSSVFVYYNQHYEIPKYHTITQQQAILEQLGDFHKIVMDDELGRRLQDTELVVKKST